MPVTADDFFYFVKKYKCEVVLFSLILFILFLSCAASAFGRQAAEAVPCFADRFVDGFVLALTSVHVFFNIKFAIIRTLLIWRCVQCDCDCHAV